MEMTFLTSVDRARSSPPIQTGILRRIPVMSTLGFSGERYLLYCHADGSCSLKRNAAGTSTHHCTDFVAAINLAQDLKTAEQIRITVYDRTGKVLLQSFG